ncbi:uncharacterized protein LOC135213280 [Macrobrachium nipponense]|uniref:uncharacterized protein LOC135213280 n=1 Tax=Macrobrachium nipponense TaxID=159736 RepID=UPI0030C86EFE
MPDILRNMSVSNSHQNPPAGVTNGERVLQGSRLRPKKLVKECKIRAGTIWNVGTLTGKLREIVDVMERRRIDFLYVQETKWKGSGAREIGNGYKLYYNGLQERRNGVGIKAMKEEEKLIIGADKNGRVGKRRDGYEEVHGDHGFGIRNEDGDHLLKMAQSFELACMTTWFQKLDKYLITYESGGVQSQIDFVLVRGADRSNVTNCKVIVGEAYVKQHRLVVMDFKMRGRNPKKRKRRSRIKIWDLKGEKGEQFRRSVRERWLERGNIEFGQGNRVENTWADIREICVGEAEELMGRTSRYGVLRGEKWWWNGEVQESIKRKLKAYKDCGNWKGRHAQGAEERQIFILIALYIYLFQQVLDEVSEEQPIVVVFPEVNFKALQIVITYMYLGQVNVPAEILPLVTDLAKMLKVKGLIKLPVYWDSVICGAEVKVFEDEETLESAGEDQANFTSEPEGIVELEVSTADGEHTVSSNMQMVNCRTAVTVITNTSPCASPRKGLQSPVNAKENQASESQSSVDSSIDIAKNGTGVNDDHILIEAEDIQMSVVDERNPNHIKLSEDRTMSEMLFSSDYMDEERSFDDQTSSKEPHSISVLQKHSSRRRRDHLYKLAKYGPEDLERAIEDLKAGTGTLREIAGRWGVPKSTLSVSAKIAGISSLQKPPDYDRKAIEEAKELVRAGTSYMKAAKEYNIPKSVLWRKCQKDNIFPKESQHFYSYSQEDVIRAKEMLCNGQSLIEIVKETKVSSCVL